MSNDDLIINHLGIILNRIKKGTFSMPPFEVVEKVKDSRQAENVSISGLPCPHGSRSGTKMDCGICFENHFIERSVRN